jgi:ubiquinone/menaquinone biosynthesis C-methylase UbiE
MIKYIQNILNSQNNPNYFLLKVLIIVTFIYILCLIWKRFNRYERRNEGFTQNAPYIIKKNDEIYDEFYVEIYDELHRPKQRISHELINVINTTKPTVRNSNFLDIGSGTGIVVKILADAGYKAHGVDKSKDMIEHAEEKYPDCSFKEGDVLEPMCFDKKSFSHILCSYFTIYHFADKITLFRNCYNWLLPNGYLILHLVDIDKFDAISPAAKANLVVNPHKYEKKRITKSSVRFDNYEYNLSYDYRKIAEKELYRTEKFKDPSTGNVRENELLMHIDTPENILKLAKYCGFVLHAEFNMKDNLDDEYQYIYILERI